MSLSADCFLWIRDRKRTTNRLGCCMRLTPSLSLSRWPLWKSVSGLQGYGSVESCLGKSWSKMSVNRPVTLVCGLLDGPGLLGLTGEGGEPVVIEGESEIGVPGAGDSWGSTGGVCRRSRWISWSKSKLRGFATSWGCFLSVLMSSDSDSLSELNVRSMMGASLLSLLLPDSATAKRN